MAALVEPWDNPNYGEPPTNNTSDHWLRKAELLISSPDRVINLSSLRFTFAIHQAETASPNYALVRIYNLADETVLALIREYTEIIVQAGYYPPGRFGVVFRGQIKQFDNGREDNRVDTFLNIWASDADQAINYSTISQTLPAGWTWPQLGAALSNAFYKDGVQAGRMDYGNAGILLPEALTAGRGKVIFGPVADHFRIMGRSIGGVWSIQNNVLQFTPQTGYQPGTIVVLNSDTGLIGIPTSTPQGIKIKCLLDSSIRVGNIVQIDNKLINQTSAPAQPLQPGVSGPTRPGTPGLTPSGVRLGFFDQRFFASVTNDGFYRIWVVEHEGDSRGNPWYTNLVGLSIDKSITGQPSFGVLGVPPPPLQEDQPVVPGVGG